MIVSSFKKSKEDRSFKSLLNNQQGKFFEDMINGACKFYNENKIAKIEKISEPFRVLKKKGEGKFEGRFIANADPDFQGTLKDGYSIVFECKYTSTDIFKLSVISDNQKKSLDEHLQLGAFVYLAISIKDRYFFVPWGFFRNDKKSFRADDLKFFEVFYRPGIGINFLRNVLDY